ncbi:MAG TPA: 3-methyl-2-oxobutanoate hydroxymethyltransferase, partial [Chitinophagaceae bacterium]|nr:3-methyl-2-oxobutanoate hydroxymethyltransferase [Chitinophagaceae bacterium]
AEALVENAIALQAAGCFSIVLEKIPASLGKRVAEELKIPVIGIGAGMHVDGQVLVMHDMLGITKDFSPKFLRRYHNLFEEITKATQHYIQDVKGRQFPNESEQY